MGVFPNVPPWQAAAPGFRGCAAFSVFYPARARSGFSRMFPHGRLPLPIFGGVQPFLFSIPRGGGRGFPECFPMAGCRSRFSGVCSLFCFLSCEGEVGGYSLRFAPSTKKSERFRRAKAFGFAFLFFVSLPRRRGRRATGRDKRLCRRSRRRRPCPKGCHNGARQTAFERVSNGTRQTAIEKTVTT